MIICRYADWGMCMEKLKDIKLFLLDMDGTIYLGDKLFDGTVDFLDYVKEVGGRYMFLTNNSSTSTDRYIKKLAGMGISVGKEDFFTSVDATVLYLRGKGYKKVYALGTESFKMQLSDEGISITEEVDDDVDCLCMAYDTELTYKKLEDACKLLNRDIEYIATNPDWVCPTSYGYAPDCGSFAEMLFRATGRKPKFIGKPEPEMVRYAMERAGFSEKETAILGDRLYTDIKCGVNAKITTVFMLSGEGTESDIKEYKVYPDYIFKNIRELYERLNAKER